MVFISVNLWVGEDQRTSRLEQDIKEYGVCDNLALDRIEWQKRIHYVELSFSFFLSKLLLMLRRSVNLGVGEDQRTSILEKDIKEYGVCGM